MKSHETTLNEIMRWGCCDGCVESRRKIKSETNMTCERISKLKSSTDQSVTKKITEKRMKWYGHVEKGRRARTKKNVKCTSASLPGKRRRGRQKTRWKKKWKVRGVKEEDTLDRTKWKNDIQYVYHSGDPRWWGNSEDKKKRHRVSVSLHIWLCSTKLAKSTRLPGSLPVFYHFYPSTRFFLFLPVLGIPISKKKIKKKKKLFVFTRKYRRNSRTN